MSITLNQVVPWGRSLAEYRLLFDLSEADLQRRILGCGDGPASFNCEMTALGHSVVSVDPIYAYSKAQIEQRIEQTYEPIIAQVKQSEADYLWTYHANPDALGQHRLATMRQFLGDYEAGLTTGRYRAEALPTLSFEDHQFDLALCSHFLFLYSAQLSYEFHRAAIAELCRAASEVRIFPLLALDCQPSPHVEPIQAYFADNGFKVEIVPVPYEFQRGGNQMMKIAKPGYG